MDFIVCSCVVFIIFLVLWIKYLIYVINYFRVVKKWWWVDIVERYYEEIWILSIVDFFDNIFNWFGVCFFELFYLDFVVCVYKIIIRCWFCDFFDGFVKFRFYIIFIDGEYFRRRLFKCLMLKVNFVVEILYLSFDLIFFCVFGYFFICCVGSVVIKYFWFVCFDVIFLY